jgi:hypothetical protein
LAEDATWCAMLALRCPPRILQGVRLSLAVSGPDNPRRGYQGSRDLLEGGKRITSQPPAPDWYPDPAGKRGLRYWDGQQWHKDIPGTPPPIEAPPAWPMSTTPRAQGRAAAIAALCVAVAVLVVVVGIATYLLLKQSQPAKTSPAQATSASSAPASQPAPTSGQTAQPAPSSAPTAPAFQYFNTPWRTRCQVSAEQVTCQTCVPGQVITNAYTCTDPAPGVAVTTAGIVNRNPADIGSSSDLQPLSDGQTYHASGWTIVASGGWARFINDTTGHGMAVAPQNFDSF